MSEFANLGSDPLLVHNPYHDVMDNYYNYNSGRPKKVEMLLSTRKAAENNFFRAWMRNIGEAFVAAGSLCIPRARISVERSPRRCQDAWPASLLEAKWIHMGC